MLSVQDQFPSRESAIGAGTSWRTTPAGADVAPGTRCRPAAATSCPEATAAALGVLQEGGNAVDAAVAAAWTLAVCEPAESGVGGQTVMLIRQPSGEVFVLDGTSMAPRGASRKSVSRTQQRRGIRATTIPTTPRTLDVAHQRYGVLSRERVMAPAIQCAEQGLVVTRRHRRLLQQLARRPEYDASVKRLFLKQGRKPYRVGELFMQPRLARTLRRIAAHGGSDFYQGELAGQVVADVQQHGGLITLSDMAHARAPEVRPALWSTYRGHVVATTPPPTGGLQLLLALRVLSLWLDGELWLGGEPRLEVDAWREAIACVSAEVLRHRERWPDDPAHITPSFLGWQLGDALAAELAERALGAAPLRDIPRDREEPGETTHLCTADAWGGIVSLTQSIQSVFGGKVAHEALGFVYNNYLCTCPRSGPGYTLGPGCVPKSNVAPTILFGEASSDRCGEQGQQTDGVRGPVRLVVGAAGSRRILSSLLQIISQVVDRGLDVRRAVAAPRVHGLATGSVWVEAPAATRVLQHRLERRFAVIRHKGEWSRDMGAVQAIAFTPGGDAISAADPRRGGANCLTQDNSAGSDAGGSTEEMGS